MYLEFLQECRKKERLTRAICIGIVSLASTVVFIGCGDAGGTTPPAADTTPPASVAISNVRAASESIAFEVANLNAEAVQVTIALMPTPPEATRVAVDGASKTIADTSINLTNNGTEGARKQIRITGLADGEAYMIILTTTDSSGNRQRTPSGTATPLAPPNAPVLTVAPGDNSVALTWSAPIGGSAVRAYRIYRATGGGDFTLLTTVLLPTDAELLPRTLIYTDTRVSNGTAYRYRVSAVNANGSENSVSDSGTMSATPLAAPDAPTNLTATPQHRRVVLSWTPPAGGTAVTEYRIYRAVENGSVENGVVQTVAFARLATNPGLLPTATRAYTDTPVSNNIIYRYRVRAVNANGTESEDSDSNLAPSASDFYLHANGVTILCPFATNDATGTVDGDTYTKRARGDITAGNAARSCTSGITDMSGLFQNNTSFNADIGHWDTGRVTNMSNMFSSTTTSIFNQDIGRWNVAAVTNMSDMFSKAQAFNQNIGNWNVAAVQNMSGMFQGAQAFNQNIGNWNVAAVTNMSDMFQGAIVFNQDIGRWNVAAVEDMSLMFRGANDFNQNIGGWNIAAVENMREMFNSADDFNNNSDSSISNWNVANVTNMDFMFTQAFAFNQNLSGWNPRCISDMNPPNSFATGATLFTQQPDWRPSRDASCPPLR